MAGRSLDKETARSLVGCLENTTIDSDKICDHFGISGKAAKARIKDMALKLRMQKYPGWYKEVKCQSQ